ncbi:MAG: hypothetical protein HY886_06455 [Deltaproteobacteria bacterium]|nr:hypothetical protein [Deltaproteobacteria bacterium]
MGIFDKLNDDIKDAANETWTAIKDAGRMANLRLRLYTLQKTQVRLFAEIGSEVFAASSAPWDNPLSKPGVLKLIAAAHKLEAEKKLLLDALSEIQARPKTTPVSVAVKKDR